MYGLESANILSLLSHVWLNYFSCAENPGDHQYTLHFSSNTFIGDAQFAYQHAMTRLPGIPDFP
jgi:hypothetical protein